LEGDDGGIHVPIVGGAGNSAKNRRLAATRSGAFFELGARLGVRRANKTARPAFLTEYRAS
jgi:hypothetical protein